MLYEQALQGDVFSMVQFALFNRERRRFMRKHIANASEEFEWYKKAAEMGFADAYSLVGIRYLRGEGTDVDYIKATDYFEKAFAAGDNSWISVAKQQLDSMFRDWIVASRNGNEEESKKIELGREALEKVLKYPLSMQARAKRETMNKIENYIASSPSKPLLVWFTSNDALDDLRRKIETKPGCTKVQDRPCAMGEFAPPYNYKKEQTKFFLYHSYFDQLCTENVTYCHELIEKLGLPVVCIVNDYSDYDGFDTAQFEEEWCEI